MAGGRAHISWYRYYCCWRAVALLFEGKQILRCVACVGANVVSGVWRWVPRSYGQINEACITGVNNCLVDLLRVRDALLDSALLHSLHDSQNKLRVLHSFHPSLVAIFPPNDSKKVPRVRAMVFFSLV
mmetsp:Transcript_22686/g.69300  ORF Transcript_22686/g.69300 Transcript_22686/m.69300 type:complete len:128 (+) Transcript_22686:663-1046(+)|eukprot:scaffold51612_cov37-Tisochrysis_lutea.AAC.1